MTKGEAKLLIGLRLQGMTKRMITWEGGHQMWVSSLHFLGPSYAWAGSRPYGRTWAGGSDIV
jgi:hypothetical protein